MEESVRGKQSQRVYHFSLCPGTATGEGQTLVLSCLEQDPFSLSHHQQQMEGPLFPLSISLNSVLYAFQGHMPILTAIKKPIYSFGFQTSEFAVSHLHLNYNGY